MREFIEVTGKSEEAAIRKALEQLSLERDDVSVEVLERAKSGFLGFGAAPAKVRVYYGEEDTMPAFSVKEILKADLPQQTRKKEKNFEPRAAKPQQKENSAEKAPAETAVKAAPVEKKIEKAPEKMPEKAAEKAPVRPVAKPAGKTYEPKPRPQRKPVESSVSPMTEPLPAEEVRDEPSDAIRTFLNGLLRQMDVEGSVKVYQMDKTRYKVLLEGEKAGSLIGRRGETLDAIQQLTGYAVNRGGSTRIRIQLDAEGYREKREQSLQHLARKVAGKVLKYHRSMTLEPMNAYERHVIHTALQDVEGIVTYSTGVDPNRRVIVAWDRDHK